VSGTPSSSAHSSSSAEVYPPHAFSPIPDILAQREPTWLSSSLRKPHLPHHCNSWTPSLEHHLVPAFRDYGDDLIRTYLGTDTTARAHRYPPCGACFSSRGNLPQLQDQHLPAMSKRSLSLPTTRLPKVLLILYRTTDVHTLAPTMANLGVASECL